jgi:hypothetical protein
MRNAPVARSISMRTTVPHSDVYLERGHRLYGSVAAHRASGHAARMERKRRDIDFRDIVDADCGVGGDGRHVGQKIGEAAAIQRVVSGKSDHLPRRQPGVTGSVRCHSPWLI